MIETRIYRTGLILALLFAAVVLVTLPKWTVDDAYITYRYAENLARHGQLTFNVGEPPVEGYTGVALPLILASAIKIGLDPDPVSKAVGIISYLVGGLLLILIARRLRFRPIIEAACVVLYLTFPLNFTHVYAGLETMLFSSAVMAALLFLIRCLDAGPEQKRVEVFLWLTLLITCLVRPEGMAMAGMSGAALVVQHWFQNRKEIPGLLVRGLLFLALPLGAYFAWKLAYYGDLLPNSYYAKSFGGTNSISVGWMRDFWHRYLSFIALAVGFLWVMPLVDLIRMRFSLSRVLPELLHSLWIFVILGLAIASGYTYSQAYLLMNYSLRFFVPFYLPIMIIIGHFANLGCNKTLAFSGKGRRVWIALAAVLVIIQVYRHFEHLPGEYRQADEYLTLMQNAHIPAGKTLGALLPPEEWLVVVMDAGAIPYHSRLRTVDLGTLNDTVLARQKLSLQEMVDYAFAYDPGSWVITSRSRDSLYKDELVSIIAHDARLQRYTRAAVFTSPKRPHYVEMVYVRNDLMANWLKAYRGSD